jgi:V/A-type H+/Na+-transporting ATPase subunit C
VYEYGNARVRAMRGRLLDRVALESLAARHDLGYLVGALEAGAYAPEMSAAIAAAGDGVGDDRLVETIDLALSEHLRRTGRGILGYYEGAARELVGVLLGRRDLQDLLTAVRARAARASPEDSGRLYVFGGEQSPERLDRLARADPAEASRLIGGWLGVDGSVFEGAVAADRETGRIDQLEAALVRAFYAWALGRLKGSGANVATVRQVLGWQIDVLNLTVAFRVGKLEAHRRPAEAAGLFVEGGASLEPRFLAGLCRAPNLEAAVAELERTPYRSALDEASGYLGRVGRVCSLERALERVLARWALRLYRADPLGIGVVVGYLAAQASEVANLRLIARGLALGLDKREIFEQIWLPEG